MANMEVTKKIPIELICMMLLAERDMYGYEMVQALESRSAGRLSLNLASVYTCLKRLSEKGYVSIYTQAEEHMPTRVRVYYHLEQSAGAYKESLATEYRRTVEGVQIFFDSCEEAER